jgi:hypothetical protein
LIAGSLPFSPRHGDVSQQQINFRDAVLPNVKAGIFQNGACGRSDILVIAFQYFKNTSPVLNPFVP